VVGEEDHENGAADQTPWGLPRREANLGSNLFENLSAVTERRDALTGGPSLMRLGPHVNENFQKAGQHLHLRPFCRREEADPALLTRP